MIARSLLALRCKLCTALLVGLLAAIPAASAGPARNGLIVYAGAVVENANPEIYAFPIGGGPRQNISRSPGSDVWPIVSPDGTKVVFRRDGREWVFAASDGTGQRALPELDGDVGWAPDSRHLVGTVFGDPTIVIVVDTDSLATQRLGQGDLPRWSPRGAQIAYIGPGGELFVAVPGEVPARVAPGPVQRFAWSPRRAQIAYIGPGGELFVAMPGEAPARIAAGPVQGFAWSPDGTKIAYVPDSARLAVIEVATTKTRKLAAASQPFGIEWSPDSRRIYFRRGDGRFSVPATGGAVTPFGSANDFAVAPAGARVAIVRNLQVAITTPDGTVVRTVGKGRNPVWSPNGRQLAFFGLDDMNLHIADARTGNVRVLAEATGHRFYRYPDLLASSLVWRPDGSAVIAGTVIGIVQHDLFVTQSGGRDARLLRRLGVNADDPEWSPDGSSIAFTRYGATPAIMVGDDRLRRLRVVAQRGSEPTWSPDGSQLAYVGGSKPLWSLSPFVGSGIFVVGADGRNRRRITSGRDWSPAWSPDGTTLAFARATGNAGSPAGDGSALYLLKFGSGPARPIFDAGSVGENGESGEVVGIAWSPDGNHIAFRLTSFTGLKYYSPEEDEVVVVNRRGRVVSRMSAGTSVTWSPDGRYLLHGASVDLSASGYGPYLPGSFLSLTRPNGRPAGGFSLPQRATSPSWQPRCTHAGSSRADRLRGGTGSDLLCGLGGGDVLTGGAGRDRIFGQAGNDRIRARDGSFDVIGCGEGRDVVFADSVDQVGVDCERVERQGPERHR